MAIETVVPPVEEPLSLALARDHVRQDLDVEDTLIAALIAAARAHVEAETSLRLITQDVEITRNNWCGPVFPIPVFPVQSIVSVQYKDTAGATQTWDAANYQLVKSVKPNHLAPAYGLTWPTTRNDYDAVTVTVRAGYGDNSNSVPPAIVHALQLLVGHFYENRQDEIIGTSVGKLMRGADRLLAPYRLHN